MKKKSQMNLFIIGLLILLGMLVGVSYAVWQITLQQNENNVVTSDCFEIEFRDKSPIHLDKSYPISDEEGMKLAPYEFTIKNNCNSNISYTLAMEVLSSSTLSDGYVKSALNSNYPSIINTLEVGIPTIENATAAYILESGSLSYQQEKKYELRLWVDYDTPALEETMNALWEGKVTFTANYLPRKDSGTLRQVDSTTNNGMWKYRDTIKKIVIQNEIRDIEGQIQKFDESMEQNESVISYIVPNADGSTFTAYLQSNKKLYLNENSSYLFYQFNQVDAIEGFEYLDTSKVTSMARMFSGMSSLTSLDLSSFDTSNVTDMSYMFSGMSSLSSLDLSYFDTSSVTNMLSMLSSTSSLRTLNLSGLDFSKSRTTFSTLGVFSKVTQLDLSYTNFSHITDLSNFLLFSNLLDLDMSGSNFSNVTATSKLFNNASKLVSINLEEVNFSKVTDMNSMFDSLSSLSSLNMKNIVAPNVTDMSSMFSQATNLTNLDLTGLDTSKVTNMSFMFSGVSKLTSLDLSHFNTSNVTNMTSMFYGMSNLSTLNLKGFNTLKVTNMSNMFYNDKLLKTINYGPAYGLFMKKSDCIITNMFYNCPANKPTGSSWNGAF